jgi:hypothetical protein
VDERDRYEGWGWTPADEDDEQGAKATIRLWFDGDPTLLNGSIREPYESLGESKAGRDLLRRAQLEVARRASDVEDARFWMAGLGLIPDPYPAAPDPRTVQRHERAAQKRREQ